MYSLYCHSRMEIVMKSVIFLVFIAATTSKPTQLICGNKAADLVFVLDASSSIWEENFQKQLDFVNNIVDMLDVGNGGNQTRIGTLTFSDYSVEQFHLDSFLEAESIKGAISKIPYQGGSTDTSDALRTTRLKMFSPEHSRRPEVVRIAVVLTDGQSQDTYATYQEAKALKLTGVQVFAIGVGFGIDEYELEAIASSPSEQFVFTVDGYEFLDSIKNKLAIRTCEVTRTTSPAPPSTTPTTASSIEPSTTVRSTTQPPTELSTTPSTVPSVEASTTVRSTTQPPTESSTSPSSIPSVEPSTTVLYTTQPPTESSTSPTTIPSVEPSTTVLYTTQPPTESSTSTSTIPSVEPSTTVLYTTQPPTKPSTTPSTDPSTTISSFTTVAPTTSDSMTTDATDVKAETSSRDMFSTPPGAIGDQPAIPSEYPKVCQGKPAEVFFMLDSSSSILEEDFQKQSLFIQHVVQLFDLGDSKTRVGLSTFSDAVYPMINLGDYNSKKDLIDSVDQIPYLSGGTNTGEALRDMRERGMAPEVVRREVAHVAIMLTDGQSRDPQVTAAQAKAAKSQGLYVFAIGIGDSVDMLELEDIASEPSSRFVFHVSNYAALESIKEILAIRACEVDPSPILGDKDVCPEVPTDVMFMYDSGKMGSEKSAAVSHLITRTISHLPMSEQSFKFGVLADTCPQGDVHVALTSDRKSLSSKLVQDNVRDLGSLFYDLRTEAFLTNMGGRLAAKKVAVVFLDDKLADYDKIVAQAKRTKSRGIEIIVVATSAQVPVDDVRAIASQPINTHFVQLTKLVAESSQWLADFLCGQGYTLDDVDAA